MVRARSGAVLATLTGNGLSGPKSAAFDGQRVLVTNYVGGGASLWNAADLTAIGYALFGLFQPYGACSDGTGFWITAYFSGNGYIFRY